MTSRHTKVTLKKRNNIAMIILKELNNINNNIAKITQKKRNNIANNIIKEKNYEIKVLIDKNFNIEFL